MKSPASLALSILGLVVLAHDGVGGQSTSHDRTREDIFVVRSVRVSRANPSDFCSRSKTTFGDVMYEDDYRFVTVSAAPDTGILTQVLGKPAGSVRGCIGSTANAAVNNFYIEGELNAVKFTGLGKCETLKSDFPESGLRITHCFLNLGGLDDAYVGGLLTSNSMGSRNPLGAESDPPGYVQPSIATVRLWKRRDARSR